MLSDLEDETSGDLEKIYNLLLTGTRQNPGDEHVAEDVLELYKAGAGKWGTNEGVFIRKLAGYDREYNEKLYWGSFLVSFSGLRFLSKFCFHVQRMQKNMGLPSTLSSRMRWEAMLPKR